jgi:hypothetical protein
MSYNSALDVFFSYWYLNLGVLLVFILIAFFLRRAFIKSNGGKLLFRIFFFGIVFLWMITYLLLNPMYLGYGKPCGVDGMMSANGKVYVVDYLLSGGSRISGPGEYSRIHVLDAKKGDKIIRFPAGLHGTLYGVNGDSLIFYNQDLISIFSASTGKAIAKWDDEDLPKVFPELSAGIDHIMICDAYKYLEITTLDAKHYNLSLENAHLYAVKEDQQAQPPYVPTKKMYLQNDNEIKIDDQPGGRTLLQLQGTDQNQEVRLLKGNNGNMLNNNLEFIMGGFIALDEPQKCFVVESYETTQNTGFILRGISLDGQNKLWELKQSTLRPDDDTKYPITTSSVIDENSEILFFAMQDEVMAIEILTGNILWRQKL